MGQLANSVRASIEQELEKRKADIHAAALEAKLASEAIDVTIPGKAVSIGHQHPMKSFYWYKRVIDTNGENISKDIELNM